MKYERFKELWHKYVTPKADSVVAPKIIDHGTPRVNAELVKYANGEPSQFDGLKAKMDAYEAEHRHERHEILP